MGNFQNRKISWSKTQNVSASQKLRPGQYKNTIESNNPTE